MVKIYSTDKESCMDENNPADGQTMNMSTQGTCTC